MPGFKRAFLKIPLNHFTELQSHFEGKEIVVDRALEIRIKLPVTLLSGSGASNKIMTCEPYRGQGQSQTSPPESVKRAFHLLICLFACIKVRMGLFHSKCDLEIT